MRTARAVFLIPPVLALACLPASGQSVISAQSGLVHYVEGKAFVGDVLTDPKFGQFPHLKENEIMRTELGRAEVLLNPGVFLRLAEDSSIRMLSTRLTDCRVELLQGSMVIEAPEAGDNGGAVTVVYQNHTVWLPEKGVYRFDTEPAQLRVFHGEATVSAGGQKVVVKKGKLLLLDGTMITQKFDAARTDALDRWSRRRAEYLAIANISAAKQIADTGVYWTRCGWYWNPYFGMFTYVPLRGVYRSPYGWSFWSPGNVYSVFYVPPAYSGGWIDRSLHPGYSTVSATSTGNSGTLAIGASAPTTSSRSATAPIARDSGSGGSRGR